MELSTALVWTLRIVLPIILFCIYFKLQATKEEGSGPTNNVHSRAKLLARREATTGSPPPDSMKSIALKDQTEAPQLFAGGRGDRGDRGGKGGRRGKDESREGSGKERRGKGEKDKEEAAEAEEAKPADGVEKSIEPNEEEEKMHLESLLNYVAFTRKEQQRIYLPAENCAPPPPPPPKKAGDGGAVSSTITAEDMEKANSDAQLVLRGALNIKRSDVAKQLYEQLQEAHVEASESTFELVINVCLQAKDLKGASDFLMKMETAGHLPSSDLLDQVMELYSRQKNAREQERQAKAEALKENAPERVEEDELVLVSCEDEVNRTKLSSNAAVFVPSFIPPPPAKTEEGETVEFADDFQEFMPRTQLTAQSKPFEPKFNVTFDPFAYSWSMEGEDMPAEFTMMPNEKGQHKNGKGKGKRKDGKSWDEAGKGWEYDGDGWDYDGDGWEHESKGWEKGKGKGKSQGHTNGKNWEKSAKDWSSDWYSDSRWSDSTWEAKAPSKKVWVEKQSKESEGKKAGGKTWKPKVEATEAEDAGDN